MTELEPYVAPAAVLTPVDSWVGVVAQVGDLASKIAGTDFVPEAMRGKPAAVAAAILAGREMGVPPMTALQHIHIVKGKPGQSAQLMRSLILSAGHQLRYVETTTTRCVVEGRRRGEDEWTRVQFTADDAKKASIQLGSYPEDKLVARATSRLARRVFPDAIGGLAYTPEELEDGLTGDVAGAGDPGPAAGRTARRAGATGRAKATATQPPVADAPPLDAPPLDEAEVVIADPVETSVPNPDSPVTKAQLTKLHTVFSEIGWDDRDDRIRAASAIVNRSLISSNELTRAEARVLIDTLEHVAQQPEPVDYLSELIAATSNVEDAEVVGETS